MEQFFQCRKKGDMADNLRNKEHLEFVNGTGMPNEFAYQF